MTAPRESKEARFRRLAEARVNKIISMLRLLGNLSWKGTYDYSNEQVEQIFTVLQSELERAKNRFLHVRRRRFFLSNADDTLGQHRINAKTALYSGCRIKTVDKL